MARMKMVPAEKIPICRLIEENTDSQASALMQAELLKKKYMHGEELEDMLKERLKQTDPHAYKILCAIDKQQDEIINEILRLAQHIRQINYQSNALLKKFDVRGERRQEHVDRFLRLFG